MSNLLLPNATELLKEIQSGNVSSVEIARLALQRAQDFQSLNAVLHIDKDIVTARAKELDELFKKNELLPLHGLPIVIKDNIDTKDFLTTAGTPALALNQPPNNAPVVQRLLDAGVLIIGKSNLDELAGGITGNNPLFGPIRNPYSPELMAGGSSGGSAAAVSAGIVPIGIGTDTGGSARIPASLCGVCGFRPSVGRYSADGVIGIPRSRATIGIVAPTVENIALLDAVITLDSETEEFDLTGLRIGIPYDPFFKGLDSATEKLVHAAIADLRKSGVTIIEKNFSRVFELNDRITFPVALHDSRVELEKYLSDRHPTITLTSLIEQMATAGIRELMATMLTDVAAAEKAYRQAIGKFLPELLRAYDDYFNDDKLDAMIYPTTLAPARPIGQDDNIEIDGEEVPTFHAYARNCDPGANARIPSLSLPVGMTAEGLPVGMSIDGRRGSDRSLLGICAAISRLFPTIPSPASR